MDHNDFYAKFQRYLDGEISYTELHADEDIRPAQVVNKVITDENAVIAGEMVRAANRHKRRQFVWDCITATVLTAVILTSIYIGFVQ